MNQAASIVDPSGRRRGACPTLTAPMQTGDGLLARVRARGGILSPSQLKHLAGLALTHGNGMLEVSARGNLQVRGLTVQSAPIFADAVAKLVDVDTGLVVETSPISGDDPHEITDPRPIAQAIATAIAPSEQRLGPKVTVVIDGRGQIDYSALKADIRLVAIEQDLWQVYLGQGKPQVMTSDGAVKAALAVLSALAALGPEARAADLFAASVPVRNIDQKPSVGPVKLLSGRSHRIALPFAAADGQMLIALADAALAAGISTFRLAPAHTLIIDEASPAVLETAARLGFITDPSDPRLRVSACVGENGCHAGLLNARDLGRELAKLVPSGKHLHVSGCAKGCAHPAPTDLTVVGMPQGAGLVISGRAGDTPSKIVDVNAIAPTLGEMFAREADDGI